MERYEEILKKAKSADINSLSFWYSLFGLRDDPFLSDVDGMDYFIPDELVDGLVYDIGVASRGVPITTLLVGPRGSGKTSILKYVEFILSSISEKDKTVSLKGKYVAAQDLFEVGSDDDAMPWMKMSKEKFDFILIDDAQPEQVKLIVQEFASIPFKLFSCSSSDIEETATALKIMPKIMFTRPVTIERAAAILSRRLELAAAKDRKPNIFELFTQDALANMQKYSMGVVGLLLRAASKCLEMLKNAHYGMQHAKDTKKLQVTAEIATQACKLIGCYQAYVKYPIISQFKMEVLKEIMRVYRSPTEVSSILQKDRTTISRHLSDVREMGLAEFRAQGRESMYRATEPVRTKAEIEMMPKEVWKIA